jgi:hypothetical protein
MDRRSTGPIHERPLPSTRLGPLVNTLRKKVERPLISTRVPYLPLKRDRGRSCPSDRKARTFFLRLYSIQALIPI